MDSLDNAKLNKLIKLAGMFGSDYDGERATAARMACDLLASCNTTWEALLQEAATRTARQERPAAKSQDQARPKPAASDADPRETPRKSPKTFKPMTMQQMADIALCRRHVNLLDAWEQEFISDLARQERISPKQAAKLREIVAKVRCDE